MKKNHITKFVVLLLIFALLYLQGGSPTVAQEAQPDNPVALIKVTEDAIEWQPQVENDGFELTISGPENWHFKKTFSSQEALSFSISEQSSPLQDGTYTYELRALPILDAGTKAALNNAAEDTAMREALSAKIQEVSTQTGYLSVKDGKFFTPSGAEESEDPQANAPESTNDFYFADDVIVDGKLCAGNGCVNNEAFGAEAAKLKQNNVRLYFHDDSVLAGFPTNDWQIVINEQSDGSADLFAIQDYTANRRLFVLEAGAPANSLYVDSQGDVGINTSNPYYELHIKDNDTPTVRLEQDNSSGWTAQTWDMAGNEANFFIRDATNSHLVLRLQPGAPSDSLTVKSSGNVGVGTWYPEQTFHVYGSDGNTKIQAEETSATTARRTMMRLVNNGSPRMAYQNTATGAIWTTGTASSDRFIMTLNGSGADQFSLSTSGNLTIDGTLTQNSNFHDKENFALTESREILEKLSQVPITTWNFKADETDIRHMGPMAQDFYAAFGLGVDNEHLAPIDTNGVAFATIQGLNEILEDKDRQIITLEEQNNALESRVDALEAAVRAQMQPSQSLLSVLPWALLALTLVFNGVLAYKFFKR